MAKAIRIREYGGLEVLGWEDVEIPKLQADEVLVRVHAAGVNPADAAIRQGYLQQFVPVPTTLGIDLSGVVDQVGAEVVDFTAGDEVFGMIGYTGAYAEYAVVKAAVLAPKPSSLNHVQAAAVPLAALTAWQMLFEIGELSAGQRVLIQGAAGGVGSFAVQFAKHTGAYVLGTARAENADYLRDLGVDEPIDYTTTRFEEIGGQVDVVVDLIGGETQDQLWSVLKPGGVMVSAVSEPSAERAQEMGTRGKMVGTRPNGQQLREIGGLIDAGEVRVFVSQTFPIEQAAQAHEQIQTTHTRGKLVLTVRD